MLFQISEDFRSALDEGRGARVYGVLLQTLSGYALNHFGQEEQCMARYHCPAAETNSRAHAQFINLLKRFQQRYDLIGFDGVDAQQLVEFVDQWLADHIARIDVQLRHCITGE
jgi:hemerythrin